MRGALLLALSVSALASDLWAQSDSPHLIARAVGEHIAINDTRIDGMQIRARKIKTCETVDEWSGWIDVDQPNSTHAHHLYWHSFASRNDPKTDPVQLWLNGGPGCSSLVGMLTELGPCRVTKTSNDSNVTLEYNQFGWNSNVTMIFLDQPVGVGFSYADNNTVGVYTTEGAAPDVHRFLQIWLESFKDVYGVSRFHMSGESFAGRYIPIFADYIVQQNTAISNSSASGRIVPLESVLIGNGSTDEEALSASYEPVVCQNVTGIGIFVNDTACAQMLTNQPRCEVLLADCQAERSGAYPNNPICQAADYCSYYTQQQPYYDTGRNPYNVLKIGDYVEDQYLIDYLNTSATMQLYGVTDEDNRDPDAPMSYTDCSNDVGNQFEQTGDGGKSNVEQVARLLEAGVRVLIYAGDQDFICNWVAQRDWTLKMKWSGQDAFAAQPLAPWYVGGKEAGFYRLYGNLTFATIHGAGHYVPRENPQAALAMERAWVQGGADGFKALSSS